MDEFWFLILVLELGLKVRVLGFGIEEKFGVFDCLKDICLIVGDY